MPSQSYRGQVHLALIALLAAVLLTLSASAAQAATYNVTTQADDNPGNPADCAPDASPAGCSLREAVRAANLDPAADQINVPAGEYVLTNDDDDPDGNADLDVEGPVDPAADAGSLTIVGAGARSTTIRSGGYDGTDVINSRLFDVEGGTAFDPGAGCQDFPGGSLDLRGVRLSNGTEDDEGGAIRVLEGGGNCAGDATNDFDGKLTLRTVALTNNTARGEGGAIYNEGEVAIFDSLIAGNTSRNDKGGGIRSNDSLTMVNTTISGNLSAGEEPGGGLSISSDDIETGTVGGELFGRTDATNVTIAYNQASLNGGGVHADGFNSSENVPQFFARNTIIAENRTTEVGDNCFAAGSMVSRGNNLDDDDSCNFGSSGDLSGTDAGLLSRGNNGGQTDTIALSSGSAAVDAGTNDECPAADQRGTARPQGARCDIGAFELVPAAAAAAAAPAPATGTTTTNTVTTPVFVSFPRLLPLRVTARVTKTRTGSGLRLRTTGRVAPPAGLSARDACSFGIVTVSVKSGTRTVSTRLSELRPDCTYISTVTFRVRSRLGRRILSVGTRFAGNDRLLRRSAPRVSAGRP